MDKAYILNEIKRTAAENGGTPLGQSRFFTETGIKISAWKCVHWSRWGDALQEAGFSPNQFNTAYENEELLQKYASFASEIRRLPVDGDLRMKSRNNPTFPSAAAFARLGSKTDLVRKVATFCRDRPEYENVIRLCDEFLASQNENEEEASDGSGEAETTFGFVYMMKSGRFYKIGHSNSAVRREYELSIQLPEKLSTVHTIRTDDPPGIEAYWHKRFKDKQKNGEWFDLNAADIAAFKRRKFM